MNITFGQMLALANQILLSANVIIGFSLLVYIVANNRRSTVARAFCALIAFVTEVYLVDLIMDRVSSATAAQMWLRIQWIGIALVPAAYLQFSEAVLGTTGASSRYQKLRLAVTYVLGIAALCLALFGDQLVYGLGQKDEMYHLLPGDLFWVFALYYGLASAIGWGNIIRAQARCLTSTSRRRMGYLKWAFAAPGIGVFPYLLLSTTLRALPTDLVYLLTLVGNMAVAVMVVVIGYIVAYQGVLSPDRVIKHDLIHFLLRGPLAAILVVGIMLIVPRTELILGIPRDVVLTVAVAGGVVLLQILINWAKPAVDRLIYRADRDELAWIQTLDERLLTTTDLEQFLENTLIAICELLRVPSGFIIAMEGDTPTLKVFCGQRDDAVSFLAHVSVPTLLDRLANSRRDSSLAATDLVTADGYWLLPLRARTEQRAVGLLGIRRDAQREASLSEADLNTLLDLVHRAEMALEDTLLQQRIFGVLANLESEVDQIQRWRSIPRYATGSDPAWAGINPVGSPSFVQAVKDALTHYWGGPKLSQSPLLSMRIVNDRLAETDNIPAKAVRAVLKQAIEMLRPPGEPSLSSNEWLVYNILDMRFIQGKRIRDIAQHLAISESDYYRKQRVAIEQVAEVLARMESIFDSPPKQPQSMLAEGQRSSPSV